MKVLHINSSDVGGAAKACERLHFALCSNNFESKLLTLFNLRGKPSSFNSFLDKDIPFIDRLFRSLKYRYNNIEKEICLLNKTRNFENISFPKTAFDITTHNLYKEADIIHLHWVARFLDYTTFFKKNTKPVIWTLHDLNPFSGLFHYNNDLINNFKSYQVLDKKIKSIKFNSLTHAKNLTFVAISDWMQKEYLSTEISDLFPCVKISNGIDLNIFRPQDKSYLRKKFSLPLNKKIILFASENIENERKGFKYLLKALKQIKKSNILLCILGKSRNIEELDGYQVHNFGFIEDETILSQIYALADLFVITSLEDNFPNTVLEAVSSGVPIIGFQTGGISEMVINNETGALSVLKDVKQLSENINTLLEDEDLLIKYSINSRKFSEEFLNIDNVITKYRKLYYEVC